MAPEMPAALVRPLRETTWRFYAVILPLAAIAGLGVVAYGFQVHDGLGVTGLNDQVSWGLYLSLFIVLIAISMAGTLISAMLRLMGADWRRPITRLAEAVTASALLVAAVLPLVDMGRPDRILNVFIHGRLESGILWDIISLTTYLSGSLLFLYLPLIPDAAMLRDARVGGPIRQWIYRVLAMGWRGTKNQVHHLEKAIRIMAVLIIPVAVSIHTVTAWIFAMTQRVGWHSALFGPFFVGGALLSGVATLLIVMAILRSGYHLEEYLQPSHFRALATMLLLLDFVMIYLTLNEVIVAAYNGNAEESAWIGAMAGGPYRVLFWTMIFGGFFAPAAILLATRFRSIAAIIVAAVLVNVGMLIERVLLVVPAMSVPIMPGPWGSYSPTWVEWAIAAGALAGFALIFALFTKLFPIVSAWETSEPQEEEPTTLTVVRERSEWTAPVTVLSVIALMILAIALPAFAVGASGDTAPSASVPRPVLTILPTDTATPGVNTTLVAQLRDADTLSPLEGRTVSFSMQTTFGWRPLGSNESDEGGNVTLVYMPAWPGAFTVGASFAGDSTYGVTTALSTLVVSAPQPAPEGPITPGGLASLTVIAVIGAVWATYAFVAWQILAIKREEGPS
ncbi:MAG: NrfD/PsrC family molybdoenzyme membrane anchor subunit [Candidatus Thermoplasmatota archaeon]